MASTQETLDAELMRQIADGSTEALEALHRRFARTIFRLAAHTLDRAAVEDLVQDVFLAIWRNAGRFRSRAGHRPRVDPPDRALPDPERAS
jgi:RNA polymerase sigma-70 factor (ECF subfamily)